MNLSLADKSAIWEATMDMVRSHNTDPENSLKKVRSAYVECFYMQAEREQIIAKAVEQLAQLEKHS